LLLFLEKEEYNSMSKTWNGRLRSVFGGHAPKTPLVGFAEVWVAIGLPRSGTTLFASFSGKRRILD
jgi:hypothetical protein